MRLAIALALVFALGSAAVALAALAYGRDAARQSYDRLLVGAATQIARSITLREGAVRVDLPQSAFELLSLAPDDRVAYAVYDAQGHLVTGDDWLAWDGSARDFITGDFAGEPIRIARVTRPLAERGYTGQVEVLVGQTTLARQELAAQITRNAVIAAAIAGLVMASLAVFAVRSALGPVRRVEAALADRSPRDLTPLTPAVPQEIAGLVMALNRLMARLDRQMEIMRHLIADASHQLRTPIAALRVQAELAEGETDPERLRRIVDRIHARSVGLSHLTDQLLNHALIIHRADAIPPQRLDLRTVAIRAVEEADAALPPNARPPDLDLPEQPVWCQGDALSLAEASKNLLRNALRHGQPPVRLQVRAKDGLAIIAALDTGPGIPAADWADAGHRYVRDTGVSPESAGLGLAIAQAVAAAHGGRLRFAHDPATGFEAALALPLSVAEVTR